MSNIIDLGNDEIFSVKLNGKSYDIREPTVKDATAFQKAQKDKQEGDEISLFINFLEGLGLPRDIAENLSLSKIEILTKRIMGNLEKK